MGKNRTTTTKAEPWKEARPALRQVIGETQSLYDRGGMAPAPYTGERVAGLSGATEGALGRLEGGSSVTPMSIEALSSILDPEQLALRKNVIADDVKSQLGSTFSGGSINSGLAQDTYTRAMTEAMAGADYDATLNALRLAPSIAGMERSDMTGALGAGRIRDEYAQRGIDADMAQYYEGENQDLNALRQYASIAGTMGGQGGTSTSTEPVGFFDTILPGIGKAASGIGGFWEAVF